MNYNSAKTLIKDTFNYPFDEGRYRNFVINLLNDVDEGKGFPYLSGNYIKDSFKGHVSKYLRIGTYTDPEGEKVDVLIVHLKNRWSLERSRTMLRNFAADYLKNRDEKDAALIGYTTDNPDDWRFSFVRMEYKIEETESGKIKVKEELTPAKRYSFLVGKNEPNHTAQAQLVGILENDRKNPTINDIEAAFSVDAVTKQFYKDYRSQFEKLWNELNDIVSKDPKIAEEFETKSIDTANFAKKLMGQIVFLYFLQKKGWLGVGKDDNGNFKEWGTGPKNFLHRLFKKEFTDYGNFFNDVLEPFFYEALASERHNDIYSQFNCKIPFLNGGLFEPLNDYNWEETDILIDNDLIADVFNTFDQYNFTVREDEPLEKEVAVDPEMLGKVFENLLPENLRKGKGAYYTPRTIVHYMCQESLINYLDTECEPAPREDIETLIREGDIILELETAIQGGTKYKPVLMDSIKENAQLLDDALANIKVCDPAIGSGAFPVGMLNEIVKARNVLNIYLGKKRSIYDLKRHCIQNSLYGVDIDPGAIEIAKLRLWLSLVVDEDDYTTIQALPNLDYKIMQGNSLIEEFHGISLDIEKKSEQKDLFAGGSDLDALIDDLHQKQADFFNAEHHREKKKKRQDVETAIYNIFHSELGKNTGMAETEKKKIEAELKEMTHGNKIRNFFPWKLYFADVFREKGGFDVVIANPPYISIANIPKEMNKLLSKQKYETYSNNADIYCLFFEKEIRLTRKKRILSYISSNRFCFTNYGVGLRKYLSLKNILQLINFNEINVFEGANVGSIVTFVENEPPTDKNIYVNEIKGELSIEGISTAGKTIERMFYKENQWSFDENKSQRLKLKIESNGVPFVKWERIFINRGVTTGANRIFVVDTEVKNRLCKEHHSSNEIIMKVLRGRDIKRFNVQWNGDWLIFTRRGIDIDKYPAIKNYLLPFKKILEPGIGRKKGKYKWFEIQDITAFYPEFEKRKLIWTRLSNVNRFTISEHKEFSLDSTSFAICSNIEYLCAILNSKVILFYFKLGSVIWGKDGIKWFGNYFDNIPIPQISKQEQFPFVSLVNQILTAKKANPESDTSALEAEIDRMVYELYGLTEEEIGIVEEKV